MGAEAGDGGRGTGDVRLPPGFKEREEGVCRTERSSSNVGGCASSAGDEEKSPQPVWGPLHDFPAPPRPSCHILAFLQSTSQPPTHGPFQALPSHPPGPLLATPLTLSRRPHSRPPWAPPRLPPRPLLARSQPLPASLQGESLGWPVGGYLGPLESLRCGGVGWEAGSCDNKAPSQEQFC